MIWPFSTIKYLKAMNEAAWGNIDTMTRFYQEAKQEIADLKARIAELERGDA